MRFSIDPLAMRVRSLFTLSVFTLLPLSIPVHGEPEDHSQHEISGKATLLASYNDIIDPNTDLSRLDGDDSLDLAATLQLSYEYSNDNVGFFSHLQLTTEAQGDRGDVGIVQLYGYFTLPFDQEKSLTFSAGQFFMPSSMENTEDFWDSPYSNNFSALNTWIAEEVRPVGLEVRYDQFNDADASAFGFGVMGFVGNDSMGSQLTWRGWSIGRHKSVYSEILPLPPLSQIDQGVFADQRVDGSKPFGRDLDNRYGYLLHGYWSPEPELTFKLSYFDNKGDGRIYRGEYAWVTRFSVAGARWDIDEHWTVLGETMWGDSAMGKPAITGVDVDFDSSYILARYQREQWDYSLRLEQFESRDRAVLPGDLHDQGRALTLAARWRAFGEPWTVIMEWIRVDSQERRTRVLDDAVALDDNESQLSVSLSYEF